MYMMFSKTPQCIISNMKLKGSLHQKSLKQQFDDQNKYSAAFSISDLLSAVISA